MNINETLQLLEALRLCGAKHFKSADFEISMDAKAPVQSLAGAGGTSAPAGNTHPTVENKEATKRAEDLIQTLKLKDEDLMNKIFPAGA